MIFFILTSWPLDIVLILLKEVKCWSSPNALASFPQVFTLIVAVSLHHGNGRAITSTSSDSIKRMLGLVEKELNTALSNMTNEKSTEQEKNSADGHRLTESDLPSQEALQSVSDASGESAPEATPVWRHKRSLTDEPNCYTGKVVTIRLKNGKITTYPICRQVAKGFTACSKSISPKNDNKRKCQDSNSITIEAVQGIVTIPTRCSCKPTYWHYIMTENFIMTLFKTVTVESI